MKWILLFALAFAVACGHPERVANGDDEPDECANYGEQLDEPGYCLDEVGQCNTEAIVYDREAEEFERDADNEFRANPGGCRFTDTERLGECVLHICSDARDLEGPEPLGYCWWKITAFDADTCRWSSECVPVDESERENLCG